MGHVYPDSSADPVDIVAWWAERAGEDRKYPLRLVEDAEERRVVATCSRRCSECNKYDCGFDYCQCDPS